MKNKIFVLVGIILLLIYVTLSLFLSGFYKTPEDAVKNYHDVKLSSQYIIDIVSVENNSIVLYLSNDNEPCGAFLNSKVIWNTIGWKIVNISTITHLEKDDHNKVIQNYVLAKNMIANSYPKVLFGVTTSPKTELIKINNKPVNVRELYIKNNKYFLWYIIGGDELENPDIKPELISKQ